MLRSCCVLVLCGWCWRVARLLREREMLASRSCMGGRSLKAGRSRRVAGRSRRGCAKCVCRGCACNMVGLWGGWRAAGAEGRAATVGSYGMSQRVREAACMVPDAWQSTWVGDSAEWAHARARASRARKFDRRGKRVWVRSLRATSGRAVCAGGKRVERRCVGRWAGRCRVRGPGEGPCQAREFWKLARAAPNKGRSGAIGAALA